MLMSGPATKQIVAAGTTVLVVIILMAGTWPRPLLGHEFGAERIPSEQQRSQVEIIADTLTLGEVRNMIVGTWIENTSQKLGQYERGRHKWVFDDNGTVKKYRDGNLFATESYSVVHEYDGQQAPDDIAGYLEFTDSDGDTYYATIESIRRGQERPHLYVGTHGMAGSSKSLYFMPPRMFE